MGRWRVSEWLAPLCSRSGTTTVTSATRRQASARTESPCARMPSSLLTRIFNGFLAIQDVQNVVEGGTQVFYGFPLQCMPSLGLERTCAPILLDALARAVDGEFFSIQQVFHQHDQLDFAALVDAVAGAVLGRIQESELALPVAQDVGL